MFLRPDFPLVETPINYNVLLQPCVFTRLAGISAPSLFIHFNMARLRKKNRTEGPGLAPGQRQDSATAPRAPFVARVNKKTAVKTLCYNKRVPQAFSEAGGYKKPAFGVYIVLVFAHEHFKAAPLWINNPPHSTTFHH
jgi:hypothetical protein